MRFAAAILIWMALALPLQADQAATWALNNIRADRGQAPVTYSKKLEKAARAHARDMSQRGFFAHVGSDGKRVGDRVRRAGYQWCHVAENLGYRQENLTQVLKDWAASPSHYRAMVHPRPTEFGIARTDDGYWVMVLADRC